MKIQVLSSAMDDLHKGRLFYERQGEGVGEYYFDSLFADIDSLALYAGIHQKIFGYCRMLAKRFPFAIYYKINDSQNVIVYRVLDLRQHPQKILRALK